MTSWLFGPVLAGRVGRTALSLPPGTGHDNCLSQELRRNTLRIPRWEEKNSRTTLLWRREPRHSQGEPPAPLSVEEETSHCIFLALLRTRHPICVSA